MLLEKLIFTHTIQNFQGIKSDILSRIETLGTHSMIEPTQRISNTDWYLPETYSRTYVDPFADQLESALQTLKKEVFDILPSTPKISNYWFQQYEDGDFHDWHNHPNVPYVANVFVELAAGAETQFMVGGEERTLPVKEGQILFFPAFLPHRSPPNHTGVRKTSIAINIFM